MSSIVSRPLLPCMTLVYLGLPYLIFFGGWFRLPYSVVAAVLLLAGCWSTLRGATSASGLPKPELSASTAAKVLLPVAVVALLLGIGGVGYQDTDYLRGNAILRDLIDKPWPVIYETQTGPILLVYYFAFYLPGALAGKLAGWGVAHGIMFAYGFVGLALVALWTIHLTGLRRWWCVPVFLALSGLDIVGMGLRTAGELATNADSQSWKNLEWWAGYGFASLPSHLDALVMAPKQALPAWLLTALVLHDARRGWLSKTGALYLGLGTLWAPYVVIGLLPFVVTLVWRNLRRERAWASAVSLPNAAGVILGLMVFIFFLSRFGSYQIPVDVAHLHQEKLSLTPIRYGTRFWVIYPLFVLLEFGLLHAVLYRYLAHRISLVDSHLRVLLVVSTVGLCMLPWINWSWNNDIVMRACLPMLFITALVAIVVLGDDRSDSARNLRWLKHSLLVLLAVGWLNVAWIAGRQITGIVSQGNLVTVPNRPKVLTLFELQEGRYEDIGYNFVGQYLGSVDTVFGQGFMRRQKQDE